MHTTPLLATLLLLAPTAPETSPQPVGVFDGQTDVGGNLRPGSATYDAERQEYVVEGSGANMWFDRDELHLVWKRLAGDFILRARAEFIGSGVDAHRKLGWIVRSGLGPGDAYADVAVHGDGLTSLQYRRSAGADTEEIRASITGAEVIQLARQGGTYVMSVARFGDPFVAERLEGLDLPDEVYVGLFVCSHDPEVTERAVFGNVRIIRPAADGFVPYRDYIGSNLEVLDVETGHRRIVHRASDSLQAPNWTPDGKALIYNRNGLLYRFDLDRGEPAVLDTGFADRNNNDHVLSFDGALLGISHHAEEHGGRSIVYVLPAAGGRPRQVSPGGPSYLHGFSPDGRYLVYTAERDGDYDVYRIPFAGGEEVRLTRSPGLDDGSEYSPDGAHIYFNSVRSGTMQLWRMKPDGGDPEQLTDDGFNNWFPHVSPDGKHIVFLSYSQDVAPGDHPFYEQIYIRRMPAGGGRPEVIAYVYGGQGTINVPSWSPDSKSVAFVSNTGDL